MTSTETPKMVSLQGKIHYAHATRTTRNGAGVTVPIPACGQRSGRFHPSLITAETIAYHLEHNDHVIEVTCKKCLAG